METAVTHSKAALGWALLAPLLMSQIDPPPFSSGRFSTAEGGSLPYRFFHPQVEAGKRYPLLLFLHGAGERGSDNQKQLRHGIREFASSKNQAKHPCFLVAPQCPAKHWWTEAGLLSLLPQLISSLAKDHAIDEDRIYISGLSMGGFGTWSAIAARPELYAAAVPICGGGDPTQAARLRSLPIWSFHGQSDRVVTIERTRQMIAAIRAAGGHPRSSEYPKVGHDSWTRSYANPELHEWLFSQRRGQGRLNRKLHDGDRILFFGDSITAAAVHKDGYIQILGQLLKAENPKLGVKLIGAGISGHRVPDLEARVERDVIAQHPTIVVIYIGINDVWHLQRGGGTPKKAYEAGLRRLVKRISESKAQVILCTPSVIGEKFDGSNPLDSTLEDYAALSRQVARDLKIPLLDLRQCFIEELRRINPKNVASGILTRDGVHLTPRGNRFLAGLLLAALSAP